ncbi:nucleotidyltransferase family protein [Brevundimonas sp. SGAir0440]|uniref:nucleotidyltransferase family protein n=1 Tax=Brevundimonas sp. SGAir0440 TaxID=2579977 RepID=UPI0010CD540D|nr:nucleotidyltransferase family protein [Brevundimonas sp. SGAir0440]QCQ99837.1 nucleotidyltransferase family protein [Brevundimonas sp. SGAir0440]
MSELEAELAAIVRADAGLMHVLTTVRALDLPDWRLVSGAVYQAVWNARTGRPAGYGVKDYDLAYFDASDLSYEAEDVVIKRVAAAFDEPFRSQVEVRNQARVRLWFQNRFGEPYEALGSTDEALGRFVAPTFAVGVRLEADDSLSVAAPFGLDDVFALTIRPNPNRPVARGWAKAVDSARARWPELTVIEP